jgi:hypothetical protein
MANAILSQAQRTAENTSAARDAGKIIDLAEARRNRRALQPESRLDEHADIRPYVSASDELRHFNIERERIRHEYEDPRLAAAAVCRLIVATVDRIQPSPRGINGPPDGVI